MRTYKYCSKARISCPCCMNFSKTDRKRIINKTVRHRVRIQLRKLI